MTVKNPLLPDRHRQRDFFVCDIINASPKDDLGSMEHPLFTLSKTPDTRIRTYEHKGNTIKIVPSAIGLATIFDKDILIYCISHLVEALNRGREINRTLRLTAYDLLVSTNRDTGGHSYKNLELSFQRLTGIRIFTNVKSGGLRIRGGFGLMESFRIIEKSPDNAQMVAVEITLSEWLYRAVCGNEVLTINRDYFRLKSGLDRRLYELARKHCGSQPEWKISTELLYKKSGAISPLKNFRFSIKRLVESNHLPDYKKVFVNDR
jgi:plasmid replication initiation protein